MRELVTLFIGVWGVVILLMAVRQLVRGRPFPDVAAVAVMGLLGIGLAIGVWYFVGWKQKSVEKLKAQPVAVAVKPPKPSMPPSGPIEMRQSKGSMLAPAFYALCFLLAAGYLARYPDTLWTRWLSWPAASVCVLVAVGWVLLANDRRNAVYVADAQGIDVRRQWGAERILWKDVAAVKLVETRRRQSTGTRRSGITVFESLNLLFQDREGEELLSLSDLAPQEAYHRFLEAIPTWAGKPVQNETVIN